MRLEEVHTKEVDRYIAEHHYLQSVPAGAKLRLWIKDDEGNIIGAMMWGRPTARTYDFTRILELTRLYMIDETEQNAEQSFGMARKHIRKHLPEIKGLISYSSTGENHKGTIYEADGWFAVGTTEAKKWNKEGRANVDISKKIRWVRSV